jgi:hypothetical protein
VRAAAMPPCNGERVALGAIRVRSLVPTSQLLFPGAVIPAKAGIQKGSDGLDPGFRRGDERKRTSGSVTNDTDTKP